MTTCDLTDNELNEAIAKFFGWEYSPTNDHAWWCPWLHRIAQARISSVPSYCSSFDTIHKVMKTLPESKEREMDNLLTAKVGFAWKATARQYAECFYEVMIKN